MYVYLSVRIAGEITNYSIDFYKFTTIISTGSGGLVRPQLEHAETGYPSHLYMPLTIEVIYTTFLYNEVCEMVCGSYTVYLKL